MPIGMVSSQVVPAARKSTDAPFAQGSPRMSGGSEYGARYSSPSRSPSKRRPQTAPSQVPPEPGSWAGPGIPIDSLLLPWSKTTNTNQDATASEQVNSNKGKPLPHVVSFTPDGLLDVGKLLQAATKPRGDLDRGGIAAAKGKLGQETYVRQRGKGIQPVLFSLILPLSCPFPHA
jgi:hypothetical protein